MGVYIQLKDKLQKLSSVETWEELKDKPNIKDDSSDTFYIADSNGNIIAKIDADGIHTTKVVAQNIDALSGDLSDLQATVRDNAYNLEETIRAVDTKVQNINDDESGEYCIVDQSGNIIARIDKDGIHAPEMTIGTATETKVKVKEHVNDSVKHITSEERSKWNNKSDLPNILDDESGEYYITDKDGNIIFKVDKDGVHTTNVTLSTLNDVSIDKYAKLEDIPHIPADELFVIRGSISEDDGETVTIDKTHIEIEEASGKTKILRLTDADDNVYIYYFGRQNDIDAFEFYRLDGYTLYKITITSSDSIYRYSYSFAPSSLRETVNDHIDDTVSHITSEERTAWNNKSDLPNIEDDESGEFNFVDPNGNIIARIDKNGIHTTAVKLAGFNGGVELGAIVGDGGDYFIAFPAKNGTVALNTDLMDLESQLDSVEADLGGLQETVNDIVTGGEVDLSGYVKTEDLDVYALKSEIPEEVDLTPYAKTEDLDDYALKTDIPEEVDLTPYAKTEDLTPYQTKEDNSLETDAKTIVGGINEVKSAASSLEADMRQARYDIDNIAGRVGDIVSGDEVVAKATNAEQLGGVPASDYAKTEDLDAYALKTDIPENELVIVTGSWASSTLTLEANAYATIQNAIDDDMIVVLDVTGIGRCYYDSYSAGTYYFRNVGNFGGYSVAVTASTARVTYANTLTGITETGTGPIVSLDTSGSTIYAIHRVMTVDDLPSEFTELKETVNDHIDDTVSHITSEERTAWNNKSDLPNIVDDESGEYYLVDQNGNIIFKVDKDGVHATTLYLNGARVTTDDASLVATESTDGLMSAADKKIVNRFTYDFDIPKLIMDGGASQVICNDDAVEIYAAGGFYHDGKEVAVKSDISEGMKWIHLYEDDSPVFKIAKAVNAENGYILIDNNDDSIKIVSWGDLNLICNDGTIKANGEKIATQEYVNQSLPIVLLAPVVRPTLYDNGESDSTEYGLQLDFDNPNPFEVTYHIWFKNETYATSNPSSSVAYYWRTGTLHANAKGETAIFSHYQFSMFDLYNAKIYFTHESGFQSPVVDISVQG